MGDAKNESVVGVKTFFVVPDLSSFPEEFLKSFFLKGYETYFLDDDPYCPLDAKIHVLFSTFPQLILFFNIDRPIRGIDWPVFIAGLQRRYGDRAMIGVTYHKRNNQEEVRRLEKLYLYTIGIVCGCIPMEYQKTKNLFLFLNVLAANQANGQRKYLRVVCDDTYKANMDYRGASHRCTLRDLSISHFSCVFIGKAPDITLNEKVKGIQMNLRGIILQVDGVLCLKRVIKEDMINVFVFRASDGKEGLNQDHLVKVNDLIFHSLNTRINELLRREYGTVRSELLKKRQEKPVLSPAGAPESAEGEAELESVE